MITVNVTINRPVKVVWDYFTTIDKWNKWYGCEVEITPTWEKGAKLIWGGGGSSPITKYVSGKEISIIWQFHGHHIFICSRRKF